MLLAAVEVRRVDQSMLSEQDAVVGVRFDHVALFENILRLLPETKTIAVIIGNSPPERFWIGEVQRVLKPLLENKVKLIFYNERPFEEILKEVASLPPHSAIFFQQLTVDGAGAVYGDKEPLKRIYEVANAPIFTFDESFFNGEVVGGPMFSPAEGARPTAAVAVRMLGGEKAGGIKVPPIEFSAPKYDWRQLQRWNISESRLPPGSEILFREPTAWERYSWQIGLVAAVVLIQAGLIALLLREHRRRQFAEVQARQRMAELAHVNRFSTAGELTASIAHEINQPLGAILMSAESAEIILKSSSPDIAELGEIVSDILHNNQRATEVIRRMRSLLKKAPFELKSLDLNDLARETVEFLSTLAIGRKVELRERDHTGCASDPRRPHSTSTSHSEPCRERDRRDEGDAERKSHHQHPDFARRRVCRAVRVRSRTGHSRRQIKRGLQTVFHHQGGRHGHGAVHRAHHCRGARRADTGEKSGWRRRVVPDQTSSCPIVGDLSLRAGHSRYLGDRAAHPDKPVDQRVLFVRRNLPCATCPRRAHRPKRPTAPPMKQDRRSCGRRACRKCAAGAL